ncbi:hypothetical protein SDC9_45291 [bioreactor metagenome]|uniref:Uncharacterized protein n=1 Tax=bioreactor metagenome TaxID=1076179 RepID=A0A644W6E1_9ZZZZ
MKKIILPFIILLIVPLSFIKAQDEVDDTYFNYEVFCIDTITIKNPILLEYKYKYKHRTGKRKRIVGRLFYYSKEETESSYKLITSKDNIDSLCLKYNDKKDKILLDDSCYLLKYGPSALINSCGVNTSFDLDGILKPYRKNIRYAWRELFPETPNKCKDKISYSDDYPTDKFVIFLYKADKYGFFSDNELYKGLYIKVAVPIIDDTSTYPIKYNIIDTLDNVIINKEGYKLVQTFDNEKKENKIFISKYDTLISVIDVPEKSQRNVYVKRNKSGFELTFGYFDSLNIEHSKKFIFKYKDSKFFLTNLHTYIIDDENMRRAEPIPIKKKIKPQVPIDKFRLEDYL